MGRKIVAFLGETFYSKGSKYVTMPPNLRFLQLTFGEENIKVISPLNEEGKTKAINSFIDKDKFYVAPVPENYSTKTFYLNIILKPSYLSKFLTFCDTIIDSNKDAIFWARTPSPGSILFAFRVLKKNRKLIHHICGDAKETWKDAKYRGLTKLIAYCFSKVVLYQQKQIVKHKNTINLASGSKLFNFSQRYSPKTFQFLDIITQDKKEIKPVYDIKEFTFTFIGRIVDDKGIFELISAYKKFIAVKGQIIKLNIIGDGPDFGKLKLLIGERKDIHLHGFQNQEEIAKILTTTKCVVIPSKTNEGFPRTIMEAWSFGLPIIVSQIGGISAFVKNEINGLIVEPGDINQLYHAMLRISNSNTYNEIVRNIKNNSEISTQKYWSDQLINNLKVHL